MKNKIELPNLIGVSGHIGSGRDLTTKIIQYLTSPSYKGVAFTKMEEYGHTYDIIYKNEKFAGKVKDIVCLLLGCTREQLEDSEFKNKELGEEWWYWITKKGMIPFIGNKTIRMASKNKVKLTPRKLMQLVGTECGRQIIHPNIWVNATFADYVPRKYEAKSVEEWEIGKKMLSNWIISDLRFPNELEAIKSRGGIVIRVVKSIYELPDKYQFGFNGTLNHLAFTKDIHESENALDRFKDFDVFLVNDGTINDLEKQIKEKLKL